MASPGKSATAEAAAEFTSSPKGEDRVTVVAAVEAEEFRIVRSADPIVFALGRIRLAFAWMEKLTITSDGTRNVDREVLRTEASAAGALGTGLLAGDPPARACATMFNLSYRSSIAAIALGRSFTGSRVKGFKDTPTFSRGKD